MLHTSDEEMVEQSRENPYLQYFLGFREYCGEAPFNPNMYVHFRQRLAPVMARFNDRIIAAARTEEKAASKAKASAGRSDDDPPAGGDGSAEPAAEVKSDAPNQGQLLLDATCTPADITYTTDLKLFNEAREKTERIIDRFYEPLRGAGAVKPRTYRKKARKHYLEAARSRHLTAKKHRRAVGRQRGYVRRNLDGIDRLLQHPEVNLRRLTRYQYQCLLVISELYRQQRTMFKSRENRIDDRIVSISQPHVRPIVRGKAGARVEFGAKVAASVVDGYVRFDHICWNSINESQLLQEEAERYRERYGCAIRPRSTPTKFTAIATTCDFAGNTASACPVRRWGVRPK